MNITINQNGLKSEVILSNKIKVVNMLTDEYSELDVLGPDEIYAGWVTLEQYNEIQSFLYNEVESGMRRDGLNK
jgi:hypothetical protein